MKDAFSWRTTFTLLLACPMAALIAAEPLHAQCPIVGWMPGNQNTHVTGGQINAFTVYNGELIAGGLFTHAGGMPANNVARWNGSTWQPLGSGTVGDAWCVAVYNGELIAGGRITAAGGAPANRIARWNGSIWQTLGSGLTSPPNLFPRCEALAVYNGELIAAGSFDIAGSVPVLNIARWNGSIWQAVGEECNCATTCLCSGGPEISALAVYDGDLIVGGDFVMNTVDGMADSLALWNGSTWHTFGNSVAFTSLDIRAFVEHNGDLIVAGDFDEIADVNLNSIARWNGSTWSPLGAGLGGSIPICAALTVFEGDVIAGGVFTTAGGLPANRIARWNGVTWSPMASGLQGVVPAVTVWDPDGAGPHQLQLVAGGSHTGGQPSIGFARWSTDECCGNIIPNGVVDVDDMLAVITGWGPCPSPPASCAANLVNTGPSANRVDVDDLLEVIATWGPCR